MSPRITSDITSDITSGAGAIADALRDHGVDTVFGLPGVHNLALWPASIFWRIEQDTIIALPTSHLARSEFGGVVDQPADWFVGWVGWPRRKPSCCD